MTPLVEEPWARQSDCSSASNGVAAARSIRVEYIDRILSVLWGLKGFWICWFDNRADLVFFLVLLKAVAGS